MNARDHCPQCETPLPRPWRKMFASRESPITCTSCGTRLYPRIAYRRLLDVLVYLLMLVAAGLSVYWWHWAPVAIAIVGYLASDLIASRRAPLDRAGKPPASA